MIPASTGTLAAVHSDGSLVQQITKGNQSAADQLYRRYVDRIRMLAKRSMTAGLAGKVEADDIVQSVFRRFFVAVGKGRYAVPSGEELGDLLVAITLNRVRSAEVFYRAARRDLHRTDSNNALIEVSGCDRPCDDSGVGLSLVVKDLIKQLPPDHQEVVADRMYGYEVAEIAARMGRSKRSIERMLQEARSRLCNLLEGDA